MRIAVEPALLARTAGGVPAASLLDDALGAPALLRCQGDWSGVIPDASFLSRAPALTMAVGAPREIEALFDLVAEGEDEADAAERGFTSAPIASVSAALLVRNRPATTWDGLVAESATYSMLQSGPEFTRWLASQRPHEPARDGHMERVRVQRGQGVSEVVLARPARHNALDQAMRDELYGALADLEREDTTVIVRGKGPSFCSGGDLSEFGSFADPSAAHLVRLTRSVAAAFGRLGPRLVVGLHGACLGAGIELAAFAGTIVTADDAVLGLPELGLGLIPGSGGTVSIPRRIGRQRFLSLLLAGPIDASTARDWGLVDEVVGRDGLQERLAQLAHSSGLAARGLRVRHHR